MALETAADYPIYYAATEDNTVARWRPLVHWAMAIPHFIVGYLLNIVGQLCTIAAWFVIMVTGKLPIGLANLIVMAQRYWVRTVAFYFGLTEQYPPFEFEAQVADPGNFPIRLDVNPLLTDRNRVTVFFRLFMVIPIAVFLYVMLLAAYVVMIIAWFAVLITGAYPVGMRNFVLKVMRLGARVSGYGALLTDKYPPFALT